MGSLIYKKGVLLLLLFAEAIVSVSVVNRFKMADSTDSVEFLSLPKAVHIRSPVEAFRAFSSSNDVVMLAKAHSVTFAHDVGAMMRSFPSLSELVSCKPLREDYDFSDEDLQQNDDCLSKLCQTVLTRQAKWISTLFPDTYLILLRFGTFVLVPEGLVEEMDTSTFDFFTHYRSMPTETFIGGEQAMIDAQSRTLFWLDTFLDKLPSDSVRQAVKLAIVFLSDNRYPLPGTDGANVVMKRAWKVGTTHNIADDEQHFKRNTNNDKEKDIFVMENQVGTDALPGCVFSLCMHTFGSSSPYYPGNTRENGPGASFEYNGATSARDMRRLDCLMMRINYIFKGGVLVAEDT